MTDSNLDLALALHELVPATPTGPDWPDVLARANSNAHRRRLLERSALAGLATLTLFGAMFATPALGLRAQLGSLLGIGSRPPLEFSAQLVPVSGSGSGEFTARPRSSFTPVGSRRVVAVSRVLVYTLRFSGLSGPATAVRLRVAPSSPGTAGFTTTLCAPCKSPQSGTLRHWLALADGRATIEVATSAHPAGELRGRIGRRR